MFAMPVRLLGVQVQFIHGLNGYSTCKIYKNKF